MRHSFMPTVSDDIQNGLDKLSLAATGPKPAASLPFPLIVNPPSNIPQSDDESENTLESARLAVLASSDPETQLVWAQDALQQVGINIDNRDRLGRLGLPAPDPSLYEDQIRIDAINIVSFLAQQNHPKAEYIRGTWVEHGRYGNEMDKKEAFRCYSHAADKGFARAQYRLGLLFESNGDPAKALVHYHRGVEGRDPACLYRIGMMTLRGQHGQPQDFAVGIDLIRQSAELADENAPQGAYVWGMLLAGQLTQVQLPKGFLVLDELAARIEIEKAAFLKFSKAQLKMGSVYELGAMGCDFDPTFSIHYYALAARQGESEAELGISKWFLVGHEGLFPKSEQVAYEYAQRAAMTGLATAEFAMGYYAEQGIHVLKNSDLALEWYHKAEKHGNADARDRIASIANKQMLSGSDHNAALNRIKSQHGSKRGPRPARFSQASARLPSIGDGQNSHRRTGSNPNVPIPRTTSTPYPMDDRPPSIAPYPLDNHPQTIAPYPEDTQPPLKPTQYRHSSVDSSHYVGPMPLDSTGHHPSTGAPRPTSAASGRTRVASGPYSQRPQTTSDYGAPLNVRHVSGPVSMQDSSQQSRMQAPVPPTKGFDERQSQLQDRRSASSQFTTPVTRPSTNSPINIATSGNAHARASSAGMQSRTSSSNGLAKPPGPPNMSSAPSTTVQGRPQPPKKTGPKTFEEMGVPATKQDQECVSFSRLFHNRKSLTTSQAVM